MEIIDIIKYEGDNQTFIWKHPCEDFNTKTQLIVHESQEAIFFMNGQALDSFGAGRYTLETENIPLMKKVINVPTDGETPFHCEVYFINKTEQMAIKWGTDSKIEYLDPVYGFPLSIGACGELSIKVINARTLLIKLVGTENILEQNELISFFKGLLITKVKNYLANIMKFQKINIFEVDQNLEKFSLEIKEELNLDLEEYGVYLNKFVISTIVKPDRNPQYEKFKELHFRQYADIAEAELNKKVSIINQETEAEKMVIESQAIAKKREQEGYTYQQERGFDVAEKASENEAVGQFTNMGVGLGVMSGIGNTVGATVNNSINTAFASVNELPSNQCKFCSECGYKFNGTEKFCPNCGKETNL